MASEADIIYAIGNFVGGNLTRSKVGAAREGVAEG